jgi:hypothetical protein
MPMIVTCPCGRQLQLDEQYAGTKVRCPICQQIFQTPGQEMGDFLMENTAPPSEPASPRIAPSAGVAPTGKPDPTIFDMAPSYPSVSAPDRPRSRPVVEHAEAEGPPTRSWPILRILDICAGVLLLGAIVILIVSLRDLRQASAPSASYAGVIVGILLGTTMMVAGGMWYVFRIVFRG